MIHAEEHPAPSYHPENPERMKIALNHVLESDIGNELELLNPDLPDIDILYHVHDRNYLDYAQEICSDGGGNLDGDTYLAPGSFNAATFTAQTAISAVDLILEKKYKSIFLAGRPPGHHAEKNRGMGFCIINNIAVAAESLILNHNMNKVAIIDWDVHHGNGTQNIFYDRSDVLYISLHRYPFYPGTGNADDTGVGDGEGFTLNIPLSTGSGDDIYLENFEKVVIPALEDFEPEFILISCGFDAHRDDPLGGMNVSETAYGKMTQLLLKTTKSNSQNRILSLFEGGYDPSANSICLYEHLKELIKNNE